MAGWGRSHGRGHDSGGPRAGLGKEGLAGRGWARHGPRPSCPVALAVEQSRLPTVGSEPWAQSLRTTVQLPNPSRLISRTAESPVWASPSHVLERRDNDDHVGDGHVGSDCRVRADHPLRGGLAARQEDIVGVAVVGSWARKNARMDSDVDLVILTDGKERYLADWSWVPAAVGEPAGILRTQDWGPVTDRRIVLPSGLEIEFGFAGRSWALADPVEAGTARVIAKAVLHCSIGRGRLPAS